MTAPDLSADEKAEVARFGIHEVGDGLPVVRVEREHGRVLMTHPHDGHQPGDVCLGCREEAGA